MPKVQKSGVSKNRLEALTDGIFAFALTVLVLTLDIPATAPSPPVPETLQGLLSGLLPDFLHYVLAFVILASFWVTHHQFFRRVGAIDRAYIWLTIIGLLFVALIPFSTNLAGTFDQYPLAAMFFEGNIFIVGVIFYAQWLYAAGGKRLLEAGTTPAEVELEKMRLLVMPLTSVAALMLAVTGSLWSSTLYLFTPFFYMWLQRPTEKE
ncbi:MAG: TMEM175 family protein [Candidatus ainarchaeum sp.]|nr:TMEM175 family protein [Candidatus ainarchaeum sp.]